MKLEICLLVLAFVGYSAARCNVDCWWTGCQPNDWAVVGCDQYNKEECRKESCPGGNLYYCCNKSSDPPPGLGISYEQFSRATTVHGYPEPPRNFYDIFVNSAGPKGSITTKEEAAMALTHFLWESDGLRARREYACEGNGCPGHYETPGCDAPGQRYYGRGFIQLSWCYNYRPCSMALFGDDRLVQDSDMVARDDNLLWDTAFWFWKENVHHREGVSLGWFGVTTRAINGGLECDGAHQDTARHRYQMYLKVRNAFDLFGYAEERGCYN